MRLIDADELRKKFVDFEFVDGVRCDADSYTLSAIDKAPTIDAVPVIRCKDCVHKSEYGYCTLYLNFHHLTENMDYCSDAERKDKDGK